MAAKRKAESLDEDGSPRVSVDARRARSCAAKCGAAAELAAHVLLGGAERSDLPCPPWARVENRERVRKVVLLAALGAGSDAAKGMKGLRALGDRVPLELPSAATTPSAAAAALLSMPVPVKDQTARVKARAAAQAREAHAGESGVAAEASCYVLAPAELADNHYPLPEGDQVACPEGYAVTQPRGHGVAARDAPDMLAMDCEMCYTSRGLELTRISVVDVAGVVVYDALVMPPNPITDYNTRFSGITAEKMRGVTLTLEQARLDVMQHVSTETILVGHSLESDLNSLRLVHANVIDTALMYGHPKGSPYKPALRHLVERFLGKTIQDQGFHDSVDDARAAMELALLRIRNGPGFGAPPRPSNSRALLDVLESGGVRVAMVDRVRNLQRFSTPLTSAVVAHTDEEVAEKTAREASRGTSRFVFAQLTDLASVHEGRAARAKDVAASAADNVVVDPDPVSADDVAAEARRRRDAAAKLDAQVAKVSAAMPADGLLLVVLACGDTAKVRLLEDDKARRKQGVGPSWSLDAQKVLSDATAAASTGALLACVGPPGRAQEPC